MYDISELKQAAKRFRERCKDNGVESFLDESVLGADSVLGPERASPISRVRKVLHKLMDEHAKRVVAEAEASGQRQSPLETINQISHERVIDNDDITSLHYLELAVSLARGVSKINVGRRMGTGVLVGPRLLMTNNHVIKSPDEAARTHIQFDFQLDRSGQPLPIHNFRLAPDVFFVTSKELDYTIVSVSQQSKEKTPIEMFPWTRLLELQGKSDDGDPINIVQHPNGEFKQIALRNNNIIRIPEGQPDFLYYTTDTEPGSSGSPCYNGQWEMVALHHRSVPAMDGDDILKRDGTVYQEGDDVNLIKWVANEGTRVSAIVDHLKHLQLSGAQRQIRDEMFNANVPNPIELAAIASENLVATNETPARSTQVVTPTDPSTCETPPVDSVPTGSSKITPRKAELGIPSMSFTIPLQVHVTVGEPVAISAAAQSRPVTHAQPDTFALTDAAAPGVDPGRVISDIEYLEAAEDADFGNRKGYLEDFLGIHVPLPVLSDEQKEFSVVVPKEFQRKDNPLVLDYHHYSVAMNSDRCLAWYSASIIDGDRRFKMPDRHDKWNLDSRIDPDKDNVNFQCGEELYATKKTDRGHLTRYLDVAWGDTKEEAIRAAKDTFFFTNCALQLQGFNRSRNRWQGIEQFLLEKKAKKEKRRIVVFTGPIYSEDDPFYTNDFMDYEIMTPLAFWKLCAIVRPDNSLSATAFVLKQDDLTDLPGFDEAFSITSEIQITVADLERRTGMEFPVLREHDHLAGGGEIGTLEFASTESGMVAQKRLARFDDIIV